MAEWNSCDDKKAPEFPVSQNIDFSKAVCGLYADDIANKVRKMDICPVNHLSVPTGDTRYSRVDNSGVTKDMTECVRNIKKVIRSGEDYRFESYDEINLNFVKLVQLTEGYAELPPYFFKLLCMLDDFLNHEMYSSYLPRHTPQVAIALKYMDDIFSFLSHKFKDNKRYQRYMDQKYGAPNNPDELIYFTEQDQVDTVMVDTSEALVHTSKTSEGELECASDSPGSMLHSIYTIARSGLEKYLPIKIFKRVMNNYCSIAYIVFHNVYLVDDKVNFKEYEEQSIANRKEGARDSLLSFIEKINSEKATTDEMRLKLDEAIKVLIQDLKECKYTDAQLEYCEKENRSYAEEEESNYDYIIDTWEPTDDPDIIEAMKDYELDICSDDE